jgi:glycosyltransferase involved in cell wall biosynthesis
LKVAQVCFRYYPILAGVEVHVTKLSESLTRKGIKVDVLTTDPTGRLPKEEVINNVFVRRFKSWAPMESFFISGELKSYLERHFSDYDVVHAHSYNDLPALYAAKAKESTKSNTTFVFTTHYHGKGRNALTSFLHVLYKPFGRTIFEQADDVVCVSKYEKNLVEQNFPIARGKTLVIPNGVDKPDMTYLVKFDLGQLPAKYILYVGGIRSYKRVDRILKAMKFLSDKDTSLVIVGNGPAKKGIVQLARNLDLQDRLIFYENLNSEELDAVYRSAGVVVNLSELEAYGLVIAEALARGTPCVVSNSQALGEWADSVNCVALDDPDNPQSVARAIDSMLGKHVSGIKLQSWDDISQSLIKVYEQRMSSFLQSLK